MTPDEKDAPVRFGRHHAGPEGGTAEGAIARVRTVALLNLGYFGVEFGAALLIGSVALFADGIDFLEDAAVNLLILLAVGWNARARSAVGMIAAMLLLVPGLAAFWTAAAKAAEPVAPDPAVLTAVGLGALVVNAFCAFVLVPYREDGSLFRAAFLSARNDAAANLGVIGAGALTAWTLSPWPDVVVGLAIALLNADAAREVWTAARNEAREVRA